MGDLKHNAMIGPSSVEKLVRFLGNLRCCPCSAVIRLFGLGAVMVAGFAATGCGGGNSGSAVTPNVSAIKRAVAAAVQGCWDPTASGGNIYGAYQQVYFVEGATLGTPGGSSDMECVTDPSSQQGSTGASQLDLQTFHSSSAASRAARDELSQGNSLAVYQGGPYVLTVFESSTNELAQAAAAAASANGMGVVH